MFQPLQAISAAGSETEPPPQICAVEASSPAPGIPSAVDAGRTISVDHLHLALMARRHNLGTGGTRWAAMSNGAIDQGCTHRHGAGGYRLPRPPLLSPMDRGRITCVIDRVRFHGRSEVHRTFGCGIRALMASVPSSAEGGPMSAVTGQSGQRACCLAARPGLNCIRQGGHTAQVGDLQLRPPSGPGLTSTTSSA
ncbi:hypothetical protein PEC18_05060 [Paucibacter sp. O1-1]|nr:hypothetical protein [Paucibacter sp. O1-1]MDA3825239.1 hypothetical protein [Paucibacter sp. O1-1]